MKTSRVILFLILIQVVGGSFLGARIDDVPRMALIGAFQGELDAVLRFVQPHEIEKEVVINGNRFILGTAHGKPVIFFKTNTSMTNAAMTTQLALSNFNIEVVLFSGIAGGINPELEKGDVSIPARWRYHAQGAYHNPTEKGEYLIREDRYHYYPYGNFGMFFPSDVSAIQTGMEENVRIAYFETDPTWMKLAEAVLSELQSNEDTRILNGLGHTAKLVVGGTGVAGPVFMDNAEYREFIFNTWQADCLDMESTAIAHVCWSNATPFLIIRSLSDLAGGQKGINDIGEFHEHAEHNAARVLNAILDGLD